MVTGLPHPRSRALVLCEQYYNVQNELHWKQKQLDSIEPDVA